MTAPTHFLNVDLELAGPEPLGALTRALAPAAFALHEEHGENGGIARYELDEEHDGPDAIILRFCDLLGQLDEPARRLWEKATTRAFDIGFDSGLFPHCSLWTLRASTVSRVAALGASIVITIYGVGPEPDARHAAGSANVGS